MRLASLHASVLLLGDVPNLAQELGRLLQLLAIGLRYVDRDAPVLSPGVKAALGLQGINCEIFVGAVVAYDSLATLLISTVFLPCFLQTSASLNS
jgi:hypothetical protein